MIGESGTGQIDAAGRPALHAVVRRLVVLALLIGAAVGGYLRYNSTTCQLQRAFGVVGITCGHL